MLIIFHVTDYGTVYLYQSQKIDMINLKHWTYKELQNLKKINFYDEKKCKRSEEININNVLTQIQISKRDNVWMLMQWNDSHSTDFITDTSWIKVNKDYKMWNIKKQNLNSNSVFSFWKTLLKIQKEHTELVYEYFKMLNQENEQVYVYIKTDS